MGAALSLGLGLVTWLVGNTALVGLLPPGAQLAVKVVGGLLGVLGIRAASTAPADALSRVLAQTGTGWKTATGVGLAAVGALLSPDVLGLLPASVGHALTTIGAMLGAVGLYHAAAAPTDPVLEGAITGGGGK